VAVPPAPVSVLVADDHKAVILGVVHLLGKRPEISIVGVAASGPDALEKAQALKPQVVCLDYHMPGGIDGLELCRQVRRAAPDSALVLYTGVVEFRLAQRAMEAGARGVVAKGDNLDELVTAILRAARGDLYLSPRFAADADRQQLDLSERQMSVVRHTANGLSTSEMAERMGLSEETVRHHLKQAMGRLDVSSRAHLVAKALRNGLVQ
jgi:two-component system, NarL family, response regulator LiaR